MLIEIAGKGSREIRFGIAESWIQIKKPTDVSLVTHALDDDVRFLIIVMDSDLRSCNIPA